MKEWMKTHFGTEEIVTEPIKEDAAKKFDADKTPLDLLPFYALDGVGLVLAYGAKKYAAHNWRKGMAHSRLISAALRHIFAYARGEEFDQESGLSHLDHAACCLLFLSESVKRNYGSDDRYKEPKR
jgi:hypothetical protein